LSIKFQKSKVQIILMEKIPKRKRKRKKGINIRMATRMVNSINLKRRANH